MLLQWSFTISLIKSWPWGLHWPLGMIFQWYLRRPYYKFSTTLLKIENNSFWLINSVLNDIYWTNLWVKQTCMLYWDLFMNREGIIISCRYFLLTLVSNIGPWWLSWYVSGLKVKAQWLWTTSDFCLTTRQGFGQGSSNSEQHL